MELWKDFLAKKASNILRRNLTILVTVLERQDSQLTKLNELSEEFRNNPITSIRGCGKFMKWAGITTLVNVFILVIWIICARLMYHVKKYKKDENRGSEMMPMRYMPIPVTNNSGPQVKYDVLGATVYF